MKSLGISGWDTVAGMKSLGLSGWDEVAGMP